MAEQGSTTKPGRVATVKASPGVMAADLAAQLAALPEGLAFIGGFGDAGVVLAFGPADGSASEREVLRAVVAALEPRCFDSLAVTVPEIAC